MSQPSALALLSPALAGVKVEPHDHETFYQALAGHIAHCLYQAIAQRGQALLCVSGGASPIPLFEALQQVTLDWSKVTISLVDERCVDDKHPASNARLVDQHLLQGAVRAARWVGLVPQPYEAGTPEQWAAKASQTLADLGPADVVVLGMGEDGHTASLFPNTPGLMQALDPSNDAACLSVTFTTPPSNAPFPRITQTLAQLLKARLIILPITSQSKLEVLGRAWTTRTVALPVSYVLHQAQTPLEIWISQ